MHDWHNKSSLLNIFFFIFTKKLCLLNVSQYVHDQEVDIYLVVTNLLKWFTPIKMSSNLSKSFVYSKSFIIINKMSLLSLGYVKFSHPYYVSDLKNLLIIAHKNVVTSVSAIRVFAYHCEYTTTELTTRYGTYLQTDLPLP